MLWFAVTFFDVESGEKISQEIHGPFSEETLEDAINEKIDEATTYGDGAGWVIAIPVRFALCTDDVPELVEEPITAN